MTNNFMVFLSIFFNREKEECGSMVWNKKF